MSCLEMQRYSMNAVHAQVSCTMYALMCPVLELAKLLSCKRTVPFFPSSHCHQCQKKNPSQLMGKNRESLFVIFCMKCETLLGNYNGHLATPLLAGGIWICLHTSTATDCLSLDITVFRPTNQSKYKIRR